MNQADARVKAYIADILKKNKALNEREVKAAVRRGLKLGRKHIGAGVIREVRRALGIDRPRAITYVRNLLSTYPTLEAKKVIEEVGERFGISLQAPDVSRLRPGRKKMSGRPRPAGARKKRVSGRLRPTGARKKEASGAKVEAQPVRTTQRSSGAISVSYDANGAPEAIAHFFRSLAQ